MASLGDVALEKDTLIEDNLRDNLTVAWKYAAKRCIDVFMSSILLCMSLPLFLVVAIFIKVTSGGSAFFRQNRVGHRGKIFNIWKFSTMRQNCSEGEHKKYIRYLLNGSNHTEDKSGLLMEYFAYVDERTTKIGKHLRSMSLDELPQLINIFLGEMSLVGPRPHPVYEVDEYKEWYRRRMDVKPGLTGWSKINLRCTPKDYEESILYDLWYVDHWSLSLDIRIMLGTVPHVLQRNDAR